MLSTENMIYFLPLPVVQLLKMN